MGDCKAPLGCSVVGSNVLTLGELLDIARAMKQYWFFLVAFSFSPVLKSACIFGDHLMEMARMRDLRVTNARKFRPNSPENFLLAKQLHVLNEGYFEGPVNLENALSYYDSSYVEVRQISSLNTGRKYTLIVGWQGDTVSGGIFRKSSLELVATVGDGGIACESSSDLMARNSGKYFKNLPKAAYDIPDQGYKLFGASLVQLERYSNFRFKKIEEILGVDEVSGLNSFAEIFEMRDRYTGLIYRLELRYLETLNAERVLAGGHISAWDLDAVGDPNTAVLAQIDERGAIFSEELFTSYDELPWYYIN